MSKLRTCKICGKQYEYCGHCPSKNAIEPWRNLYCSENCRDAFKVMGDYTAKKITAEDAKAKLESYFINAVKVRDIHKKVVLDIFRAAKPIVEEKPVVEEEKEKPAFQRNFKKKGKPETETEIVNED